MEPLQQDKSYMLSAGGTGRLPSSSSQPTTFLLKKWKVLGIEECIVLQKELHSVRETRKGNGSTSMLQCQLPHGEKSWSFNTLAGQQRVSQGKRERQNLYDILKTHWIRYQKCLKASQHNVASRHLFFGIRNTCCNCQSSCATSYSGLLPCTAYPAHHH